MIGPSSGVRDIQLNNVRHATAFYTLIMPLPWALYPSPLFVINGFAHLSFLAFLGICTRGTPVMDTRQGTPSKR